MKLSGIVNFLVAFLLSVVVVGSAPAEGGVIEDQLEGLSSVLQEIQTHYGMPEFKEKLFGVNLVEIREKYTRLIKTATTLQEDLGLIPRKERTALSREEYEQVLMGLAAEFRDGHFNILRDYSADAWTLGIYAVRIEGELVITGFDEKYFIKGAALPEPKIGDRILSVNGELVEKIAERYEPGVSLATHRSRMDRAARFVLNPPHRWVPAVKTGDEVRVRFQRANPKYSEGSTEPKYLEFDGVYHWVNHEDYRRAKALVPFDDPIPNSKTFIYGFSELLTAFSEGLKKLGDEATVINLGENFNAEIRDAKKKNEASTPTEQEEEVFSQSADEIKRLAELEESAAFPVYMIRYKGKNIGVIRIPHYSMYIKEVRWLTAMIARLEKLTDVLIIDQVKNGGGRVWTGAQLARLFAHEKDFQSISMNIRLTPTLLKMMESSDDTPKEEVPTNASAGRAENPNEDLFPTANFAQVFLDQKYIAELRRKYSAGEAYSGWFPYFGVQNAFKEGSFGRVVGQEGKVYTHPVVVLNDQMSASCGDFFPSNLQVNGRALVMGATSMGLGAPVYRSIDAMPGSELFMRCPFGDCIKPDNLPIENVGAVPDLPRWITRSDLADSFKTYATDTLTVAVQLAEGKPMEEVKRLHREKIEKALPSSEAFKAVRPFFDELDTKLSADLTVAGSIQAYDDFFAKLSEKENEVSKLKETEWYWLKLSLPFLLTQQDVILMSLRSVDEIIDRLQQMRRLKVWNADPEKLRLIDYLIAKLPSLSQTRRPACYDMMKRLAEYRAPK
jgi:hypothetical protein